MFEHITIVMIDKSASNTKPFHINDPQYCFKEYMLFKTLYECEHLLFVLGQDLAEMLFSDGNKGSAFGKQEPLLYNQPKPYLYKRDRRFFVFAYFAFLLP